MNRMTQEGKAKLEELVARVMKDGQARGIAVGIVNAAGERSSTKITSVTVMRRTSSRSPETPSSVWHL